MGALPGSYQKEINGKNVLIAVHFNKLDEKNHFRGGKLYKKDKTIILTIDNFDKYLKGY